MLSVGAVFRVTLGKYLKSMKPIIPPERLVAVYPQISGDLGRAVSCMALPVDFYQFSQYSNFSQTEGSGLQAITADGLKNAGFTGLNQLFWMLTVLVGLFVLLPSQMSIIDDVCRRWTDIIWSGVSCVRDKMIRSSWQNLSDYGCLYRLSLIMQTVFCIIRCQGTGHRRQYEQSWLGTNGVRFIE